MIATPLSKSLRAEGCRSQDARHYRALVAEHDIDLVVIGLPLHTSGGQEGTCEPARRTAWGSRGSLAKESGLTVAYHDERYSTVDAEELLLAAGVKRQGRKERRDMLAAQILLQAYLDAGCPVAEPPAAPLADTQDQA